MTTVGAFNAKTHFSELLKEVEQRGQVIITKHGRPVAKLLPSQGRNQQTISQTIREILNFSQLHTLNGLDWKELQDEGRK